MNATTSSNTSTRHRPIRAPLTSQAVVTRRAAADEESNSTTNSSSVAAFHMPTGRLLSLISNKIIHSLFHSVLLVYYKLTCVCILLFICFRFAISMRRPVSNDLYTCNSSAAFYAYVILCIDSFLLFFICIVKKYGFQRCNRFFCSQKHKINYSCNHTKLY